MKAIIIADDNRVNRLLAREILKDNFEILEAKNGQEVFDILKERSDDISAVVLDIIMPVVDGYAVLDVMTKDPVYSNIPIIVVTVMSDADSETTLFDLGAYDVIQKPYDSRIMRKRVLNAINKRELEQTKIENTILREQNQAQVQLRTIVDNLDGGVALVAINDKKEAQLLYGSTGYYNLYGLTQKEFKKLNHNQFDLVVEEDRERVLNEVINTINNRESVNVEFRFHHVDGTAHWGSMTGDVIDYPDNSNPVVLVIITDVSNIKQAEQDKKLALVEMKFRANHDMITGIYNDYAFYSTTRSLLERLNDKEFEIIKVNIIDSKVLSDLLGPEAFAKVLRKLARAIEKRVMYNGTYGRIEADRFAICAEKNYFDVLTLLQDLENEINEKADVPIMIRLAAGIYHITEPELDIETMCVRANMALQSIKDEYTTKFKVYDEYIRMEYMNKHDILSMVEEAIKERQFVVYYQPIFSVAQEKPVSSEALVRWRHPERGIISPGMFIPIFEQNGYISKLDYYVWEEVCKYLHERSKHHLPMIPVSVNASRLSLYNPNLDTLLTDLIKKYKIDKKWLKIEITESAYVDNPQQLQMTINSLQNLGFEVLMDDFGSGYSSLNMLKEINVDVLKIDMGFIRGSVGNIKATNILQTIIELAKKLKMNVVAEGVETEEQVKMLSNMGCDVIQGFYYSKPLPVEDFSTFISNYYSKEKK